MTKYKLLKPIKGVVWEVGEVKEAKKDNDDDEYVEYGGTNWKLNQMSLLFLEHAGFIEEVDETPKRWRAEMGGMYYYLDEVFEVNQDWDNYNLFDNELYEAGNYFQTTEQIEEFKKGVKALVGIK